MPTILTEGSYRFFFYSLENGEPPHIHVKEASRSAKFWLYPVELARSDGFKGHELNRIRLLVIQHRDVFRRGWNEHFGI